MWQLLTLLLTWFEPIVRPLLGSWLSSLLVSLSP